MRLVVAAAGNNGEGVTGVVWHAKIVALTDEMAGMLGFAPALRLGSGLDSRASGELSDHVIAVLREALSNAAWEKRSLERTNQKSQTGGTSQTGKGIGCRGQE